MENMNIGCKRLREFCVKENTLQQIILPFCYHFLVWQLLLILWKKSSMLNNYKSSRGKGMQCTPTKSGASQNSPFNNCVLSRRVFEQEQGKQDFVKIQMLLFLKSKLLCYHGHQILVFVTTLGHLVPHSKLKAWQLSTKV